MIVFMLPLALLVAAGPRPDDPRVTVDRARVAALAGRAVDGDRAAKAELRALGPDGLDTLVAVRAELSSVPPLALAPADPRVKAWEALIDGVARQLHATESRLYWYTDLAAAEARAARDGKPILSLRLLGALDNPLSCANSRFFRTILYPDPVVRAALHDRFVLHWESVREAPQITIDFGGGKVLRRTITGNSMHYVLDARGRVVDALPGVVGPAAFLRWLDEVEGPAREAARLDDEAFVAAREAAQRGFLAATLGRGRSGLAAIGVAAPRDLAALERSLTAEVRRRLALGRRDALRIDPTVMALLGAAYPIWPRLLGRPSAELAAPLAVSKMAVERPMLPWVRNLRGSVAEDEVQDDLVLQPKIRQRLAASREVRPEAFTSGIYAEVFLTPLDDPYMGLAAPDVFTGIAPDLEMPGAGGR